jgi:HKD family nuclease
MSLLIILRKGLVPNRFNELIIKSIDTGEADSAVICSGFFQEKGFSASFNTGLCCVLKRNNIEITTIGVYNNIWKNQYRIFRDNLKACGNKILAKKLRNNKLHAKIFILKKGGEPIFGIIGSSNMTSRAFGIWKDFNFECDVVLWDSAKTKINNLCQAQTEISDNEIDDVIYAEYIKERNKGKSPVDRLRELEIELEIEKLNDLD